MTKTVLVTGGSDFVARPPGKAPVTAEQWLGVSQTLEAITASPSVAAERR
jgi:hypothetical protein